MTNRKKVAVPKTLLTSTKKRSKKFNYERAWKTLKEESGYRLCTGIFSPSKAPLKELMNNMEQRIIEEQNNG